MDLATYEVEARVEANHWWFVGRRNLFSRLIRSLRLAPDAETLDIGTSTGTNLRMLKDIGFSRVTGLDNSETAIRFCEEKGLGVVELGSASHLPFPDARFKLVLATDVIEHVDDDALALREITRVLAPSGYVLLTVPAFMSLWGMQDVVAQHKRRYLMREVVRRMDQAGLYPIRSFYFNFLLFVPIWAMRQLLKLLRVKLGSENEIKTSWINAMLTAVMALFLWEASYFAVSPALCRGGAASGHGGPSKQPSLSVRAPSTLGARRSQLFDDAKRKFRPMR